MMHALSWDTVNMCQNDARNGHLNVVYSVYRHFKRMDSKGRQHHTASSSSCFHFPSHTLSLVVIQLRTSVHKLFIVLNCSIFLVFLSIGKQEKRKTCLKFALKQKINLGICIALTQPFRAALGAESRVCYLGNMNTADRQTPWALTYYHLSQSTANQNGKLVHCHRWEFEPVIFGMLAHLSDHSAKSHPKKW
jgi:hypothetical protein